MIETFLIKIAAAIFKNCVIANMVQAAATAYEIYSVFDSLSSAHDCIESNNQCQALETYGIQVTSDALSQKAAEKLMSLGDDSFTVSQNKSGVYIASRIVPKFYTTDINPSVFKPKVIFSPKPVFHPKPIFIPPKRHLH